MNQREWSSKEPIPSPLKHEPWGEWEDKKKEMM